MTFPSPEWREKGVQPSQLLFWKGKQGRKALHNTPLRTFPGFLPRAPGSVPLLFAITFDMKPAVGFSPNSCGSWRKTQLIDGSAASLLGQTAGASARKCLVKHQPGLLAALLFTRAGGSSSALCSAWQHLGNAKSGKLPLRHGKWAANINSLCVFTRCSHRAPWHKHSEGRHSTSPAPPQAPGESWLLQVKPHSSDHGLRVAEPPDPS